MNYQHIITIEAGEARWQNMHSGNENYCL